jgi:hypothetical protein
VEFFDEGEGVRGEDFGLTIGGGEDFEGGHG